MKQYIGFAARRQASQVVASQEGAEPSVAALLDITRLADLGSFDR